MRKPLVDLDAAPLGTGVGLWFYTPDVDRLHEQVAAEGHPILQPPQDGLFGRLFVVRDPDGYTITFHNQAQ